MESVRPTEDRAREGRDDMVALQFPARPQYLRLARLAAADAGARAEFSMDEVEDLRIAVDELTFALIEEAPPSGDVTLRYYAAPGVVEVEGASTVGAPAVLSDLANTILRAVADDFSLAEEDGLRTFRLVKRSRN